MRSWFGVVLMMLAACGFPEHTVGGQVRGLWDGNTGVVLKLDASSSAQLTVTANGVFSFGNLIERDTKYTVTIASSPPQHSCTIDSGGTGSIGENDGFVLISCTGPAVDVAFADASWKFDERNDSQSYYPLALEAGIAAAVTGSTLTAASFDDTPAVLGQLTPLQVGADTTTVALAVTAGGGLSKTYELNFFRSELGEVAQATPPASEVDQAFGGAVALSGDTLVVGAPNDASAASGIGGDPSDTSAPGSGGVFVYVRSDGNWVQQAYIKPSDPQTNAHFGATVALDGDTLVVGAPAFTGAETLLDGPGAIYVFVRKGQFWSQQAAIRPVNTSQGDKFGTAVAVSGDTLLAGAPCDRGIADQSSLHCAGALYVFARTGTTWDQQAHLTEAPPVAGVEFGTSVALSDDTLAANSIGGVSVFARTGETWSLQASLPQGTLALSGDTLALGQFTLDKAGEVHVFTRTGATWAEQAKVAIKDATGSFGFSLALVGDTLAVGAPTEIVKDKSVGATYVFVRSGATWTQTSRVGSSGPAGALFGSAIALSSDTVAVAGARDADDGVAVSINQ